jgi:predicted nucleic acid-binding protein
VTRRVVLDASTLLATAADPASEPAMEPAHAIVPELHARYGMTTPALAAWEVGNVVHHERPDAFGSDVAARVRVTQNLVGFLELLPPNERALTDTARLAEGHGLTFYDASYLAVAGEDDASILLTEDRKLHRVAVRVLGAGRVFSSHEARAALDAERL